MSDFNDSPITDPKQDKFDFNSFSKSIAECIRRLPGPIGSVVAVHGPWGSGKSSVVNLVRHHLRNDELIIIPFQSWLYRSEDALAVGFFQELYAGLKPALSKSEMAQKTFLKFGAQVAGAGNFIGYVVGAIAGSLLGGTVTSASGVLERIIETDEGIESLQKEIAETLKKSTKRFLVVIDDIDRLTPQEALVIFRLVKSVGRLPNVIYLLAYDRDTTEKAVAEQYPSEGPHYLEKIVQAGFELPEPAEAQLIAILSARISEIFGDTVDSDPVHLGNIFHEIVVPEINTPRDVPRLANTLSVTYHAVSGEVDIGDFIGLETLRIFRPSVYRAIRANKSMLVGVGQDRLHTNADQVAQEYEQLFLGSQADGDRQRLKRALMRLFPRLESVWSNTHYSDSNEWSKQRRACSASNFDTYFRFSLSPYTVPLREIQLLIQGANDPDAIKSQLLDALNIPLAEGRTKASYMLDEVKYHADSMAIENVRPFLQALYSVADKFQAESDNGEGFIETNDQLRLHWLTRALLWNRTELVERSEVLVEACQNASLGWLIDLSNFAYQDYHPREEGEEPSAPEKCLTTAEDASQLRKLALQRVREAAGDESILVHSQLAYVLFRWRDMVQESPEEIQSWSEKVLDTDDGVLTFARAFLGKSFSHEIGGLGDLVHRTNDRAQVKGIEKLMDADRFRARLPEVLQNPKLSAEDKDTLKRLIEAWEVADQDVD